MEITRLLNPVHEEEDFLFPPIAEIDGILFPEPRASPARFEEEPVSLRAFQAGGDTAETARVEPPPKALRKRKKECHDTQGSPKKCPHGRPRYSCRYCGGFGVCTHGMERRKCEACGANCRHGVKVYNCRECA